jgi:hypothetical protein
LRVATTLRRAGPLTAAGDVHDVGEQHGDVGEGVGDHVLAGLEAHFVHNEVFKGTWGDELVYAMLEDEWRDRVSGGRPG